MINLTQSTRLAGLIALAAFCAVGPLAAETTPAIPAPANAEIYGHWVLDAAYIRTLTAQMEKDMPEDKKSMAKMFLPMIEMMAKKSALGITPDSLIEYRDDEAKVSPLTVVKGSGAEYIVTPQGRPPLTLFVENGRLLNKADFAPGKRTPPLYMVRLNEEQTKTLLARVEAAKRPPLVTDPADARLKFLLFKASPEQIDTLLRDQKDLVTIKRTSGETALAWVLSTGMDEKRRALVVEKLLAAGADANTPIRNQPAIWSGMNFQPDSKKELILALLKHGAKKDTLNERKESLAITYCSGGGRDLELLKAFLDGGPPVNHQSEWKKTALSAAMQSRWVDGVKLLLERGADYKSEQNFLGNLVKMHDPELLKHFTDQGLVADEKWKKTVLMMAVEEIGEAAAEPARLASMSDAATKKQLIERAAKKQADATEFLRQIIGPLKGTLETPGFLGDTVLFLARDVETAKILIEAGANPKAVSKESGTPLHVAALASIELTKFYLEKGLDVNAAVETSFGKPATALQAAVQKKDNMDTIRLLIEKGADVNFKTKGGATAISSVMKFWKSDKAEAKVYYDYLIVKGADPKIGAAASIAYAPDEESLRLLMKAGVPIEGPEQGSSIIDAIACRNTARVKLLISLGANPGFKKPGGESALDWARKFYGTDTALIKILEDAAK